VELYKKRDSRFYWYDFKWRGKRYRSSTRETNKEESREDCRFEALPSHGRDRSVGSEGSQPAGVLDSVSELGRIGNSSGEVESILLQRLALACDDENRRHAPGSHNQG